MNYKPWISISRNATATIILLSIADKLNWLPAFMHSDAPTVSEVLQTGIVALLALGILIMYTIGRSLQPMTMKEKLKQDFDKTYKDLSDSVEK